MASRWAAPTGYKFHKVMGEYSRRTLRSSSGRKVTSRKQALAIAFSEQRRYGHGGRGSRRK